jgi:hypothetical protein
MPRIQRGLKLAPPQFVNACLSHRSNSVHPRQRRRAHIHGQRYPLLGSATMTVKVERFAQNLTPEQELKVTQLEEAVASVVQASFLSALAALEC